VAACPKCGVNLPEYDGPTHRYFGASPACWAAYGKILEREYANQAFFKNHRMTVDAYALQHAVDGSPQAIQSVNIHLISATLIFKYKATANIVLHAMRDISKVAKTDSNLFKWLEPPDCVGAITVADITPLTQLNDHLSHIENWAKTSWQAWSQHHNVADNHLRQFEII